MTPTECVKIVGLLGARCPAMRLEDATPDAWYLDLKDLDAGDVTEAVLELSRRQAFVGLHEILAETEQITRRRLGREARARLDADLEAEGVLAIESAPPAEPPAEWEALGEQLKARTAATVKSAPRTFTADRERLRRARAELDAHRAAPTAQAGKDEQR